MSKGKLFLFLSAFLYGIMPLLSSLGYRGGLNGITLSFLRCFISLPLLFIMIKSDKKGLKLTRKQFKDILLLGTIGGAIPILLLYLSYEFIPIGLATTLHFVYPLIIVLAISIIEKKRLSRLTVCSVLLVTVGILMFADLKVDISKVGLILALLSGVLYSFYILYIDISKLYKIDNIVLTFYVMAIMSGIIFIFGVAVNGISFYFSPFSWSMSVVISLLTTLGAMPLLQAGIRYEGATTAGIISAAEPITTMIAGTVFLGEYISVAQLLGGVLIIMGVLLVQRREKEKVIR